MLDMFKGSDSKVSMMRVSTFLTVVTILGTYIAHNVVSMVKGLGPVTIGWTEASLLAATLGIKALQNKFEGGGSSVDAEAPVGAPVEEKKE